MKKISCLCIFIFIILNAVRVFSEEKMRIAVMDFEGRDIPAAEASKVTELIRNELINTGQYTIIERSQMGAILKEQGLQGTGCTDVSCAVEMGKILSANKILVGSVMKLGDGLVITGRVVDVELGIAEFSEKESAATKNDLLKAVESYVDKLSVRIGKGTPKVKPKQKEEKPAKNERGKPSGSAENKWEIAANANFIYAFGTLADVAKIGYGGSVEGKYFMSNLGLGITAGCYYFPGKKEMTDKLIFVPFTFDVGYRFFFFGGFYMMPVLRAGAALGMLSHDPDGVKPGEKAEYKTTTAVEPLVAAGAQFGYVITGSFQIKLSAEYSAIIEKGGMLHMAILGLGGTFSF